MTLIYKGHTYREASPLDEKIRAVMTQTRRHLQRLNRRLLPSALSTPKLIEHLWATIEQIEPIDEYVEELKVLLDHLDLLRDLADEEVSFGEE